MNTARRIAASLAPAGRGQCGTALVICMLLLLVLSLVGIAGLVTATLELRMAANAQYRERAFQAAEYAIEQAMSATDLGTAQTVLSPKRVPASGPPPAVPGSSTDTYSYRLYYDTAAGPTPIPGGHAGQGTNLMAYHFIVEAAGFSAKGASDTHVQGFYLLGPADPSAITTRLDCPTAADDCRGFSSPERHRTYWLQTNAE
ncbi:MAG: hypothetical protein FIB04_12895 [Gammaproteobacteria bacterium]|nr:hypothetical protein [Gammaproteobacteria bacterium]